LYLKLYFFVWCTKMFSIPSRLRVGCVIPLASVCTVIAS
jgi:hypothetical protein